MDYLLGECGEPLRIRAGCNDGAVKVSQSTIAASLHFASAMVERTGGHAPLALRAPRFLEARSTFTMMCYPGL